MRPLLEAMGRSATIEEFDELIETADPRDLSLVVDYAAKRLARFRHQMQALLASIPKRKLAPLGAERVRQIYKPYGD